MRCNLGPVHTAWLFVSAGLQLTSPPNYRSEHYRNTGTAAIETPCVFTATCGPPCLFMSEQTDGPDSTDVDFGLCLLLDKFQCARDANCRFWNDVSKTGLVQLLLRQVCGRQGWPQFWQEGRDLTYLNDLAYSISLLYRITSFVALKTPTSSNNAQTVHQGPLIQTK